MACFELGGQKFNSAQEVLNFLKEKELESLYQKFSKETNEDVSNFKNWLLTKPKEEVTKKESTYVSRTTRFKRGRGYETLMEFEASDDFVEDYVIPGLTYTQQIQVINALFNELSYAVLQNPNSLKSELKSKLLKSYQDSLDEINFDIDEISTLIDIGSLETEEDVITAQEDIRILKESVNHFKSIIDNFDKIFDLSAGLLEESSLFEVEDLDSEGESDTSVKKSAQGDNFNEDKTYTTNPKSKISQELKLFLHGIFEVDDNNEIDTNFLGRQSYVDFNKAFNVIKSILADEDNTIESVKQSLLAATPTHKFLNQVVRKLDEADNLIVNQFVSRMPSHALEMQFVNITFVNNNYKVSIYNTNSNSLISQIESNFKEEFKNSPLFNIMRNGERFIDDTKIQEAKQFLKNWRDEVNQYTSNDLTLVADQVLQNKTYIEIDPFNFHNDIEREFNSKVANKIKTGATLKIKSRSGLYLIYEVGGKTIIQKNTKLNSFNKESVDNFFKLFGINLSTNTLEQIVEKGVINDLYNPKSSREDEKKYFTGPVLALEQGIFKDLSDFIKDKLKPGVSYEGDFLQNDFNSLRSLKKLARQESLHNTAVSLNTFRTGEKTLYPYIEKKLITDRVIELLSKEERDRLKNTVFARDSKYLDYLENNELFAAAFASITHIDLNALKVRLPGIGARKTNKLNSLSELDLEMAYLGFYLNNVFNLSDSTVLGNNYRIAKYIFPTFSDKSQSIATTGLAKVYDQTGYNSGEPTKEMIDDIYENIVKAELDRIIAHNRGVTSQDFNEKEYNTGAGMFLFIPQLNGITIDGVSILSEIFNTDNLSGQFQNEVKKEISKFLKSELNKKLAKFQSSLLKKQKPTIYNEGTDREYTEENITNRLIPQNIIDSYKGSTQEEKINSFYLEYITNSTINYAESFKLFIGDPALFHKSSIKRTLNEIQGKNYLIYRNANNAVANAADFIAAAESTFTNIGKRLAMQIAPGMALADSVNNQYIQIQLADAYSESLNAKSYYTELLDGKKFDEKGYAESKDKKTFVKENYPNAFPYFYVQKADAQEYTTWQEHLYILEKLGNANLGQISLSTQDIKQAKEIMNQVSKDFTTPLNEVQQNLINRVFQPLKPVYTGFTHDGGIMRPVYIKTSSFPLLPQLTKGKEIDKLRVAMETLQTKEGKTVRASYNSGFKIGQKKASLNLLDNSTSIKKIKDDLVISPETYHVLNRKYFRIQQEKPFKSEKKNNIDHVLRGSQETKLLFNGAVLNSTVPFDNTEFQDLLQFFNIEDKADSTTLLNLYNKLYKQLYIQKRDELFKELGIEKDEFNQFNPRKINLAKISEILLEELKSKENYSLQDAEALEVKDDRFIFDLLFGSNSEKYQSLINSVISNRILDITIPGYSFVLGSEEGFNSKQDTSGILTVDTRYFQEVQNDIIYTSAWNGSHLMPASKENGYKHQVILPSKFRKEVSPGKWELIDLVKDGYVIEVTRQDGSKGLILDELKFDKELLTIFGFRIPTSGLNSLASIEIAGFLPYNSGDLVIATSEFITKMGSDFDVDSLYSYMYYHSVKDGILTKDQRILPTFKTQPIDEKSIINAIIDIHHKVMTHDDAEVQKAATMPIGFEFARDSADVINQKVAEFSSGISTEYQKSKLISGSDAKLAVGIYSLDVTFHAVLEQLAKLNPDNPISLNVDVRLMGKSNRMLGNFKTLDGDRSIAEVLSEFQNLVLDNEKEQLMGPLNINSYTIPVTKVLNLLGFDKIDITDVKGKKQTVSITHLFNNQPIIKDYINKLKEAKSPLKAVETSKEDIIASYFAGNPEVQPIDTIMKDLSKISPQEFYDMLTLPVDDVENIDYRQLIILQSFNALSSIGQSIGKVQGLYNTDSAQLDKSVFVNYQKQLEIIETLSGASETDLKNIDLLDDSINGYANIFGLDTAVSLYRSIYPILFNKAVNTTINKIIDMRTSEGASYKKKAKLRQDIFTEFKKYVYANSLSQKLSANEVNTMRKKIFFDYLSSNGTVLNESLASYIKKNIPNLPLGFFSNFTFTIEQNQITDKTLIIKPSTINFNANNNKESVNNLYILFNELLKNKKELPSWNGEPMSVKRLGQYMVLYSFLEGGVQEATQFTNIIPVKYLKEFGILEGIQSSLESIKTNLENFDEDLHPFIVNYFQHNPATVVAKYEKLSNKIFINNKNKKEGFKIKKSKEEVQLLPKLVHQYDFGNKEEVTKRFAKSKNILYYLQAEDAEYYIYKPIQVKGISGLSEYNSDEGDVFKSLIFLNPNIQGTAITNSTGVWNRVLNDLRPVVPMQKADKAFPDSNIRNGKVVTKDEFFKALSEITEPNLSELARNILEKKHLLKNLEIFITDESYRGAKSFENVVYLSPTVLRHVNKNSAIMEEVLHHLTVTALTKSKNSTNEEERVYFDKIFWLRYSALEALYNKLLSTGNFNENISFSEFTATIKEAPQANLPQIIKQFLKDTSNTQEVENLRQILYSLRDNFEFTARAFSKDVFTQFLNESPISEKAKGKVNLKSNLLEELRNILRTLLSKLLGLDIKQGNVLDATLMTINEYQRELFLENIEQNNILEETQEEVIEPNIKEYKYYGAFYKIVLDNNGVGVDVQNYQGKASRKQNLLDKFNENPNVDPQSVTAKNQIELFEESELTSTTPSSTTFDSQKPTITLNQEQQAAVDAAIQFIEKGDKQNEWFLLNGKAGTGKSFSAQEIIRYLNSKVNSDEIVAAAVSQNATDNIANIFKKGGVKADSKNVAQLLGLKPDEKGVFTIDPNPEFPPAISNYRYIIIDEGSMIGEFELETIFELKRSDAVVIFLADIGQISPVRNGNSQNRGKKSPIFNTKNKADLLTRVRQGEESPILPFADYYWNNNTVSDPRNAVAKPAGKREDTITNKGALIHTNSISSIRESLINLFKQLIDTKNPNLVRIVTYTNLSRRYYNTLLHQSIFGKEADTFMPNEPLIFLNRFEYLTGEFYKGKPVIDVIPNNYLTSIKRIERKYEIDGNTVYDIAMEVGVNEKTKKPIIKTFTVMEPSQKEALKKSIENQINEIWNEYSKTNKRGLKKVDVFNETVALREKYNKYPPVELAYAITAHKSQGATFDVTLVDEINIMSGGMLSNVEKSEIIYTGITRSKNITIMLTEDATKNNPYDLQKLNEDISNNKVVVKPEISEEQPAEPVAIQPKVESTEVDKIYSQLGNKTESGNVVIKSVYQQTGVDYAKSINGIFSLRVNNSDKHFGNPFSSVQSEIDKGLIPTKSTKESVEKYIDWVINSEDSRAKWIRDLLISGNLKGKPIVYYKELGEPSHATALDYLINKYNWNTKVESTEVSTKSVVDLQVEELNKVLETGGKTITGIYENSPKIIFEFENREPSFSYLNEKIVKEGENYRIKTIRYNVLVSPEFEILTVTSLDSGKVFKYSKDKVGVSTIEIESPIFRAKPNQEPVLSKAPKVIDNKPLGTKIKEGIYVNQNALSKEEQMELFNYLKPLLEKQATKALKGTNASKMIGLELRWDYITNNPNYKAISIPDVINPGNKNKYGYYEVSANGQKLGKITDRFRQLIEKAMGIDMTHYDGAIINLYEHTSFISSHNDVDESKSAIGYPVVGINIGGEGNLSIESRDGDPKQLKLSSGAGYVFGYEGKNREVWHRTFPGLKDSFLPEITTESDGKTYPAGSYRVTVTMRRVKPLTNGMPSQPIIKPAETLQELPQTVTGDIKPGVEELFNENPELANEVYEALGFKEKSLTNLEKVSNLIKQIQDFDYSYEGSGNDYLPNRFNKIARELENFINDNKSDTSLPKLTNEYFVLIEQLRNFKQEINFESKEYQQYKEYLDQNEFLDKLSPLYKKIANKEKEIQDKFRKELSKITPREFKGSNVFISFQQKQQAQQLYSQYLDSIFPGSKMKDIVYHGSGQQFEKFAKEKLSQSPVIHFSKKKDWTGWYKFNYPVLLNIKKLYDYGWLDRKDKEKDTNLRSFEGAILDDFNESDLKRLTNQGYDGAFGYGQVTYEKGIPTDNLEYVVFEPEQIHILGSKQDIEGFKNYVQNKQSITPRQGISELFAENLQLASIGTQEQYERYLSTIFPNSKVKDIVYHGSPIKNLQELKRGENNQGKLYTSQYGIAFTDNEFTAMIYAGQMFIDPNIEPNFENGQVYSVLLNIKNPEIQDFNNEPYGGKFGSAMGTYNNALEKAFKQGKDSFIATNIADPIQDQTNIIVFKPEQIHILGNDKDIEGFKEFVSKKENKELTMTLNSFYNTLSQEEKDKLNELRKSNQLNTKCN